MKTRRFFLAAFALLALGGSLASDTTASKKEAVITGESSPPVFQFVGDPYRPCATCG